jgi:probable phosphoglycerate mutase
MRPIFLARHGQTEWNAVGRLQGHTDVPLNDAGRAQARALAVSIAGAKIAVIVTSDLVRARETGEIVAAALGLGAPVIEPALRERQFGVFEGLTRDECQERHQEAWRAWQERSGAPPGAESQELAIARLAEVLARIAAGAGAGKDEGCPVLVVSHGGLMRLWLTNVLGERVPPIANAAVYAIEHDGDRFHVRR